MEEKEQVKIKFDDLPLDSRILDAIYYMGFREATPIQEQAIPKILEGKDLLAMAQTGTGKTAAFLLPTLQNIITAPSSKVACLIIAPTRELAMQIDRQIEAMSYGTDISSLAIYGGGDGADWSQEKVALTQGVDIVVATPGKLISHLNMGYVDFTGVKYLILDEADRMLDIGFHDDIMKIISFLPKERQNLMFSATMPHKIKAFANKFLVNPDQISIAISKPAAGVLQVSYLVKDEDKIKLIQSLIHQKEEYKSILIFSSTKKSVSQIVRALNRVKINVKGISSDLDQSEREEALLLFKSRQTRVLVATDVISRGIDIKDINLVINYNVPGDAEDYVHRIGRTARADTTGVAITFINEDDMYAFSKIEELIEAEILKLPPPDDIGIAPIWNPRYKKKGRSGQGGKFKSGGKNRSSHKGRSKSKGGYKKSYRKKKD